MKFFVVFVAVLALVSTSAGLVHNTLGKVTHTANKIAGTVGGLAKEVHGDLTGSLEGVVTSLTTMLNDPHALFSDFTSGRGKGFVAKVSSLFTTVANILRNVANYPPKLIKNVLLSIINTFKSIVANADKALKHIVGINLGGLSSPIFELIRGLVMKVIHKIEKALDVIHHDVAAFIKHLAADLDAAAIGFPSAVDGILRSLLQNAVKAAGGVLGKLKL